MSLGTSAGDKPWVCEVHFVYDDSLNLYFRSKKSRRHSLEIGANPNVAGNIVEEHPLDKKPRGVYFEGKASILENFNLKHPIYEIFNQRMGFGPEIIEDANVKDGHSVYMISVSDYYLFDARDSNPSQKYHLKWSNKGETNAKN